MFRFIELNKTLKTQDPDGLNGVTALRTRQSGSTSLLEQIHELESESRWNEALSCYEEAIENAQLMQERGNPVSTTSFYMDFISFLQTYRCYLEYRWSFTLLSLLICLPSGKALTVR
jgi:hypothetical protein